MNPSTKGGVPMRVVRLWILLAATVILGLAFAGADNDKPAGSPAVKIEAAAPANGSVTGTVKYAGKAASKTKLPITKDTEVCGKQEHFDESLVVAANGGIKDVVVSITGVTGGKPMTALGSDFVIDQKGCMYNPHISVVPVKTPIRILNPDGILHNVHSYSTKNKEFNMSQPKFVKEKKISYDFAEVVTLKCDVHGWMSAKVMVVDHPYHAVTDADGNFTIADVPPGTYTVEYWQEKLGKQTAKVTVAAGAAAKADFSYPAAAK